MIIGITGGIGSGKSTLAELLVEKGFLVYNTDLEARRLQNENPIIKTQLIDLFGNEVYVDEVLNRKYLANIVFNNPDLLKKLNDIVHPVVQNDFKAWVTIHADQKYLFIESAILFEGDFYKLVDKTIVVTADEALRIARVVKRDHVTVEHVKARIKNQMPEDDKIFMADLVVETDNITTLEEKFNSIFAEIEKLIN